MDLGAKIFVAGHTGMVGSALQRRLSALGYHNLLLPTRQELDLTSQPAVRDFFIAEQPEYVFLAAAKVGGIMANQQQPADFIYNNLQIQNNVIYSAWQSGAAKLLFLGSSCIYPKNCPQPIKEEYLLTGALEPTNEAYALAKIAGITMCQSFNQQYGTNFISVMPTNLYGIHDNFDLDTSHVIPALLHKFHLAKINHQGQVTLWGSGSPRREFLLVDDLADACIYVMNNYDQSAIVNIGTGEDITIKDLAEKISRLVGFAGEIVWDAGKPDGTPRKLLDVSRLHGLGWRHQTDLDQGLASVYHWFVDNYDRLRK